MALSRDKVDRLSELLDLYHYLQPENGEEEKERFLSSLENGSVYNPSYSYPEFGEMEKSRRLLEELSTSAETSLEESLMEALQGRLLMMEAIGSESITKRSGEHYGQPGEELVGEAREKFSTAPGGGEKNIGSGQLEEAFRLLFQELGISYSCEIRGVDIIRNSPGEKRILIPEKKKYSVADAKRVLVHESTHSVRTVNGRDSGSLPLGYGTKGYETAEEGLATFNEEELGVFQTTLPRITSRVIAVSSAEKSFHDLYKSMRDLGLDQRSAFVRTYRVKRGLEDTSRVGGFIKDHIYFKGYSLLKKNPDLADRLYIGKVGFRDIDSVESTPQVKRADHLSVCKKTVKEVLN